MGTCWRVVGQQVMFGQFSPGNPEDPQANGAGLTFNTDQWDGYVPARARVLEHIRRHQIDNVVVLTGDIHSSWAMDLTSDPFDPRGYNSRSGEGSLAVEFVTPGITSVAIEDRELAEWMAGAVIAGSPHIKFINLFRRGYMLLDIDHDRAQAEWYHLDTVHEPSGAEVLAAVFKTDSGTNCVVEGQGPNVPRSHGSVLAPAEARSKRLSSIV